MFATHRWELGHFSSILALRCSYCSQFLSASVLRLYQCLPFSAHTCSACSWWGTDNSTIIPSCLPMSMSLVLTDRHQKNCQPVDCNRRDGLFQASELHPVNCPEFRLRIHSYFLHQFKSRRIRWAPSEYYRRTRTSECTTGGSIQWHMPSNCLFWSRCLSLSTLLHNRQRFTGIWRRSSRRRA